MGWKNTQDIKKLKRIQVEELFDKKEIRDIKQIDKNFKIDLTLIK